MDKKQLSEIDICEKFISPAIARAGWNIHDQIFREYPLRVGRVTVRGNKSQSEHSLMPNHFAIVCAPDDEEERAKRDRWLAAHGIQPIWFADGDWSAPSEILQLLKTAS